MLQTPARVKFIERRGLDSLFHKISNNLLRIKHVADSGSALTKPMSQQCPESTPQSGSWVHEDMCDLGSAAEDTRTSQWGTEPNILVCVAAVPSVGTQDTWGNKKQGGAGLSAKQSTNVRWAQGLARRRRNWSSRETVWNLKASTVSFYSSFRDWRGKNWIWTADADKNLT